MEREDQQSLIFNNYYHRQKFKEKDSNPPSMPYCLLDDLEPFKNVEVVKNLLPTQPCADSFQRLKNKLKLPKRCTGFKILWS